MLSVIILSGLQLSGIMRSFFMHGVVEILIWYEKNYIYDKILQNW
jgi:hypothetical protein